MATKQYDEIISTTIFVTIILKTIFITIITTIPMSSFTIIIIFIPKASPIFEINILSTFLKAINSNISKSIITDIIPMNETIPFTDKATNIQTND